jgi:hypothetical protein
MMPRVTTSARILSAALAVSLLALASCGGDGDASTRATGGIEVLSGHQPVKVIDAWVTTLRKGDVAGAAGYFALPSVVQNGTPPLKLETEADAVDFNRRLPCGAVLIKARPLGRFIAATFRLTERPGGDCGPGVGGLARTAFLIRDGKIVQWRRLPEAQPEGHTGPVV